MTNIFLQITKLLFARYTVFLKHEIYSKKKLFFHIMVFNNFFHKPILPQFEKKRNIKYFLEIFNPLDLTPSRSSSSSRYHGNQIRPWRRPGRRHRGRQIAISSVAWQLVAVMSDN